MAEFMRGAPEGITGPGSSLNYPLQRAKIRFKTFGKRPKPSLTPFSGNNESILLVEDHEPTRIALTHLLSRRQSRVSAARNAAGAIKFCAQEKFDLVISDIGLPDGSGNDLMIKLRDRYGLKDIALTGYGMEQDVERSLASGFVSHLIKPVNVQSLEKALKGFFAAHA